MDKATRAKRLERTMELLAYVKTAVHAIKPYPDLADQNMLDHVQAIEMLTRLENLTQESIINTDAPIALTVVPIK